MRKLAMWFFVAKLACSTSLSAGQEKVSTTLTGHTQEVTALSFSPDSTTLASASRDGSIKLWSVAAGKEIRTLIGHTSEVTGATYSPDGKMLASIGYDRTARIWDPATGKQLHVLTERTFGGSVAFTPDSKQLTVHSEGNVRIIDSQSLMKVGVVGENLVVAKFAVNLDGKTAVTASLDRQIRMWDWPSRKELRSITELQSIRALALDPRTGDIALAVAADKTLDPPGDPYRIRILGADFKFVTKFREGHPDIIHSLAFNREGKLLASGSKDKTVRLWIKKDVGWVAGATLRGHSGAVTALAFSPDGRRLASCGEDKLIRIWEIDP